MTNPDVHLVSIVSLEATFMNTVLLARFWAGGSLEVVAEAVSGPDLTGCAWS
jgi:hypothetical protein